MPTRRWVLRGGAMVLGTVTAGCGPVGPRKSASFDVSLGGEFEADPVTTIPLDVSITVQNVGSDQMAARGVDVVLLDREGTEITDDPIGSITYSGASQAERRTRTHDGSDRTYRVKQEFETTVSAGTVPDRIGCRVDEIWYGSDDPDEANALGERRPMSLAPPITASGLEYVGERPPASTVDGDAFRDLYADFWRDEVNEDSDTLLLPERTPTPTATGGTETVEPGNGTTNETTTGTQGVRPTDGGGTATPSGVGSNATASGDGGNGTANGAR